jgi:hypothetical protein
MTVADARPEKKEGMEPAMNEHAGFGWLLVVLGLVIAGIGHRDRMGHDHLVRGRRVAALPLGRRGPGAVFRVGVHRHGDSVVDHLDELGQAMIRGERSLC